MKRAIDPTDADRSRRYALHRVYLADRDAAPDLSPHVRTIAAVTSRILCHATAILALILLATMLGRIIYSGALS